MTSKFEKMLCAKAVEPYFQAGKFATKFAHGKLSGDPVFKEILRTGLIKSNAHLVDIGCGQGLLSAWLLAAENMAADADWPKNWEKAPEGVTTRGIELMPIDVERARAALKSYSKRFTFDVIDMCHAKFEQSDAVVVLDVLHYVPFLAQEEVLTQVREALVPNGVLILRVGNAAGGLGFKISNWVDFTVTFIRGHRLSRLYCRSLSEWLQLLKRLGFDVEVKPMSQGTPFANMLLIGRLTS